jgi:hypothetical protein
MQMMSTLSQNVYNIEEGIMEKIVVEMMFNP